MKIGIYGGTFDPIHRGHMAAASTACTVLGLDKLLLIPDGTPPHKQQSAAGAPAEHRLEMAGIAADRLNVGFPGGGAGPGAEGGGKSYTSDTLRQIHQAAPKDELWLLMGTDMFLTLHLWHEPEVILSLAGICAFGRTEGTGRRSLPPSRTT